MKKAVIEALLRTPIAHRGLHDRVNGVPENSLAAFRLAAERGFPIELDVRLMADGNVAVFHDAAMSRLTGVDAALDAQTQPSLVDFRLAGTEERIPLLQNVFDLVSGRVPILIELKSTGTSDLLERAVAALAKDRTDCAVQSFSRSTVEWFRRNAPGLPRGLISGRRSHPALIRFEKLRLANLAYCIRHQPDFINHEHTGLGSIAPRWLRHRMVPVLSWTVRNPAEMERARRRCDNVVFEGFDPFR